VLEGDPGPITGSGNFEGIWQIILDTCLHLKCYLNFFVRESAKCMCLVDIMMHNCSRANCLTHG